MGFTGRCYRDWALSLVCLEPFPAAPAPTLSGRSYKVCTQFFSPRSKQRSRRPGPPSGRLWEPILDAQLTLLLLLGSVGLVSRFGQFYKSVDPGLVQVNVCTESLRVVDVKIQISPIGRQMVMFVFPSPSVSVLVSDSAQ